MTASHAGGTGTGGTGAGGTPPGGDALTRQAVERLVVERLAQVLAVRPADVRPRASLAGDLHADSLDLVEAVESIEQALRDRGHVVRVPESVLASWTTVGDAVDGFAQAAGVEDA